METPRQQPGESDADYIDRLANHFGIPREMTKQIKLPEKQPSVWMPIETAPKDGTDILGTVYYGDGVHHPEVTAFSGGRWVTSNDDDGCAHQFRPTHWLTIPKFFA